MAIQNRILLYSLMGIIIASGVGLGVYFGVFYDNNDQQTNQVILTLEGTTLTKNYTLSDLMNYPNITGSAGYRKSTGTLVGPNLYRGVELNVLLEDIGGLAPGEEIDVIAEDGYKVTFTSEILNGNLPSYDSDTGEYLGIGEFYIVLAYEIDGVINTGGVGVLRIVAIPIGGESYFTDGSPWVKDVVNISVISDVSWRVYLYGITNDSVDKATFEAFMHIDNSAQRLIYQLQEGDRTNTYEGIALWRIISLFDGEIETSTITFNDSLAISGYDVILKNAVSETLILRSEDIKRNDSYILAARKNSLYLKGNEAPLMIVGPALSSTQMIMGINEIHIILE